MQNAYKILSVTSSGLILPKAGNVNPIENSYFYYINVFEKH